MKLTITTNNQDWQFELIETSGNSLPTKTQGGSLYFESHLTVALHNEIADMNSLYLLLKALTNNFWHGLVVHNEHATQAILTTYSIRLPKEDERGVYVCEVGYKVLMPDNELENYQFKRI